MVYRALDAQRGLDPDSDLFSPGYFSFLLNGDNSVDLTAHVLSSDEKTGHTGAKSLWKPRNKVRLPLIQSLEKAMTDYVVKRGNYKSVIAGYPWFLDWGRDSLIFTRGLIAAKRYEEALAILKQFGMYEAGGTLPNMIEGENAANRDTSDAPLWFCLACRDMTDSMKNDKFLEEPCGTRTIRDVLLSIGSFYASRTLNGIAMDPESGLIFSPSHFTWMDTNHPAGTPREGYPIEIQALWFAALEFLARIDHRGKPEYWRSLAQKTGTSIKELFYLKDEGYLSDCLLAAPGQPAASAQPDDALRPNQLLAITLGAVRDKRITRSMVTACEVLLIPGAIRSLAHRRVKQPLAIYHQGRLINSPHDPYQGRYEGDEDTRRKPAYHNGTAWTWIFPSFCEAYAVAFGENSTDTALALLGSSERIIREGCVGHVPEITDGDWPHQQRGCDAQAWGVGELYRVLKKLL
jgi:starch synthase (maltosyl-transferring)